MTAPCQSVTVHALARLIRSVMVDKEWTIRDVAAATGISKSRIGELLTEPVSYLTDGTVTALATGLRIPESRIRGALAEHPVSDDTLARLVAQVRREGTPGEIRSFTAAARRLWRDR